MIHVILYHPEIPQNTGNIMRTCAATGAQLHIIGPLPFHLSDDQLKRAGMDYMPLSDWHYYDSMEQFCQQIPISEVYYITRYGDKAPSEVPFIHPEKNYYIMFGNESTGIPKDLLWANKDRCLRLPMKPFARSLNLANSVAIVVYELLRQQNYPDLATKEVLKGDDYLEKEGQKNAKS